ncbi:MAG: hypothetical protein VX836_04665 [Pseudomonadota bacterium]|nr:hypothetical protein [Pseudomonadota bacterium]
MNAREVGRTSDSVVLTTDRIQVLYDRYLDLVRTEIDEFGVKATEVRHLIGRLGELHCALAVRGTLAHVANQHGFDVVCTRGRRISVKTTAQRRGFVGIKKATAEQVDDLMIVQYQAGGLLTVYYGPIGPALAAARLYAPSGYYDLELTRAAELMSTMDSHAPSN